MQYNVIGATFATVNNTVVVDRLTGDKKPVEQGTMMLVFLVLDENGEPHTFAFDAREDNEEHFASLDGEMYKLIEVLPNPTLPNSPISVIEDMNGKRKNMWSIDEVVDGKARTAQIYITDRKAVD